MSIPMGGHHIQLKRCRMDNDWIDFETKLYSRWDKIFKRLKRMRQANPEEDIGFEIFTETTENYREILAGTQTDQIYLTAGTYHRLADLLTLGWHPRYEDLMAITMEDPL